MSDAGLQKAKATAMAVIDGLAKHGLSASPVNYSVWYAHLAGENPAMSRQILIVSNQAFNRLGIHNPTMKFLKPLSIFEPL